MLGEGIEVNKAVLKRGIKKTLTKLELLVSILLTSGQGVRLV